MTTTALDIVLLGRFVGGLVGICELYHESPDSDAIGEAEKNGWIEWWGLLGPTKCWAVTQKGWDALEAATQ